jgi:glycosyltransferase involved in cell wall biosynthesis
MKALIVIDEHVFHYGGHYYVRELGTDLTDRYLQVFDTIRVATRVDSVEELDLNVHRRMDNERVEVFPLKFFRGYKQFIQNIFKLRKQYRNVVGDCEVALVRLPSTIGFSIARLVVKKKIPLACEVVASPYDFFRIKKPGIEKILYGIYHFQLKRACASADGVAYVTESALQQHYPASKAGSFTTNYSSAKIKPEFYTASRELSAEGPLVLCHVAHPINNYEKGHDIAIRVVAELNRRMSRTVQLRFAGDGELVPEFIQLAEKEGIAGHVEFPGVLSMSELHHLLTTSDAMILPTLTEGLPRVIIEAMATGLPCVSTPVGGIPELLPAEFLCHPTDVKAFADKLELLFTNRELYKTESERNFSRSKDYAEDKLQLKRTNFFRNMTIVGHY